MQPGMNYEEMYAFVAEQKATIEGVANYLKETHGEFIAREKSDLKPAIEAIELIFSGLYQDVKLDIGTETEDQTGCNCGMVIGRDDLGSSSGKLHSQYSTLMGAWAAYQTKFASLSTKYVANSEGKLTPSDLMLNLPVVPDAG